MADLKGQQLRNEYQNLVTKEDGGNTLQDGDGNDLTRVVVNGTIAPTTVDLQSSSGNVRKVEMGDIWGGVQRWHLNNPSSGSGQTFNTSIRLTRRGSHLVLVSLKRSGSNRIDTELHIVNRSGAAGADEDFTLQRLDNDARLNSASFSVDSSNNLMLAVDLGADGDQLTVTVLG